jgi:hypothetical protein
MKPFLLVLVFVCAFPAAAQKLDVKVIDRQDHDSDYSYVVPGHSYTNSNANVNCSADANNANCSGYGNSSTTSTPAQAVPFHVRGATLSLLLPDGRIAVVNCDAKFAEHFAGVSGNHRSCREPIVESFKAEFHGGNAKLEWPVSLDGKKTESETYKILGILDKPKSDQN